MTPKQLTSNREMQKNKTRFNSCLLLFLVTLFIGCGKQFVEDRARFFGGSKNKIVLKSAADVDGATGLETHINIATLPEENYVALSKFKNLREIVFLSEGPGLADNRKLCALSNIPSLQFNSVVLNDSAKVTDEGLSCLLRIEGLRQYGLDSTSVSDLGISRLCREVDPTSVSISFCSSITASSVKLLLGEPHLIELGFSTTGLSLEDVEFIIGMVQTSKSLKYCSIDDPDGMVDKKSIGTLPNGCYITIF